MFKVLTVYSCGCGCYSLGFAVQVLGLVSMETPLRGPCLSLLTYGSLKRDLIERVHIPKGPPNAISYLNMAKPSPFLVHLRMLLSTPDLGQSWQHQGKLLL